MKTSICLILLAFFVLVASSASAESEFESAAESYRHNDYARALPAFTRLAKQGDARAQTVLALMYKYGEGTAEDVKTAFYWYQNTTQ